MSWLVCFWILRPFGPFPVNTMLAQVGSQRRTVSCGERPARRARQAPKGATLTVVLQKAKGLQRVNGLLEGPRPDVFVTVEVENEELFTSPLRCVSRRPVV